MMILLIRQRLILLMKRRITRLRKRTKKRRQRRLKRMMANQIGWRMKRLYRKLSLSFSKARVLSLILKFTVETIAMSTKLS